MTEGLRVNFVMRGEFNPYIYTLSKLSRFGYGISVFKYKTGRYSEQPPEQPAHTSGMFLHGKMDVKIFRMFIAAENTQSVNISFCREQEEKQTMSTAASRKSN